MLREFTLAELVHLDDGRIAEAFQGHIDALIQDCEDRPALKDPRSLEMKIELKPYMVDNSGEVEVKPVITFKPKVPGYKSREYHMAIRRRDGRRVAVFNDGRDHPDQQHLFDGKDGDDVEGST